MRWWQGWHSGKDGGEEEQVVHGHLQVQTATGAKRRWNAGKAKGSGQTKLCVVPGPRDSPRTVRRGTGDACGIGSGKANTHVETKTAFERLCSRRPTRAVDWESLTLTRVLRSRRKQVGGEMETTGAPGLVQPHAIQCFSVLTF